MGGFMRQNTDELIGVFSYHQQSGINKNTLTTGKPLIYKDDPGIVAICSDQPLNGVDIPVIDLNDAAAVADFIIAHSELGKEAIDGAA